ncbi:MAG TPA: S8 family serine peptidase [Polyangiaceae bacterium]
MSVKVRCCAALFGASCLAAAGARAEVDPSLLLRAWAAPVRAPGRAPLSRAGAHGLPRAFLEPRADRLSLLVEAADAVALRGAALSPACGRFAALELSPGELEGFKARHPELRLYWSPPRRALLNQAAEWIALPEFRDRTGQRGGGTAVGVIDTGFDSAHRDLRTPEGETRIRWFIDFDRPPAGFHPELEERYGCTGPNECAILAAADIDELLENDVAGDEIRDELGHGTHVTSLAAGNGQSSRNVVFVGPAPEAELILAQVGQGRFRAISDANVLTAACFIFERAEALGLPAVVNVSLGSDFGGQDGTTPLERGLAELVGPEHPGRALVVAAGNSGALYAGLSNDYPEPFGIRTEVHLPPASKARVPLLSTHTGSSVTEAAIFVWIDLGPDDEVSIALDLGDNETESVAPGHVLGFEDGDLSATVLNGVTTEGGPVYPGSHAAVVVLSGQWPSGSAFALELSGHGTARLWVHSEGDLSPEAGSLGALFPRASKEGTINVPASHPELIAVGAVVNRTEWLDFRARDIDFSTPGLDEMPGESLAYFSSAGPNGLGDMKPDIVAPGFNVIGAMSAQADPRDDSARSTMFRSDGQCGDPDFECFVIDDAHAVTAGTSMAAPLVSGAVALLFERDPDLTQDRVLHVLQAGARRLGVTRSERLQAGPGMLDLAASLDVVSDAVERASRPGAENSFFTFASSFARPGPGFPLQVSMLLRDADGLAADGVRAEELELRVEPGQVLARPERLEAGLWRAIVEAAPGSGQRALEVTLWMGRDAIARARLPIAVDRPLSATGPRARGGCSLARAADGRSLAAAIMLLLAALFGARRHRRTRYTEQLWGSYG